ncbi:MAG TPA: helix-turn-helix domain-containing protein [Streptosporangiaceae bacterium]
MTERPRVREIDDGEGQRRCGSSAAKRSVVTGRRAQMVLLSAQGMDVPGIAKVAFTSEDRVRDVIRNFNADGFGSLYPKYKGGRPPKFTLGQRREIKKIAKAKPAEGAPARTRSRPCITCRTTTTAAEPCVAPEYRRPRHAAAERAGPGTHRVSRFASHPACQAVT